MTDNEWTYQDLVVLYRDFPVKTTAEVAKALGRSERAVAVKAYRLGLKKRHYGIVWTPQMLKTLTDFFPIMFNRPLALWLGVSMRSLIRKARELGLEKRPGFLDDRREDINQLNREAQRGRNTGMFKKGMHSNPAGEFKPGWVDTPEMKAKRSASIKRSWKYRKQREELKKHGINIQHRTPHEL